VTRDLLETLSPAAWPVVNRQGSPLADYGVLEQAHEVAQEFLQSLQSRRVASTASMDELRAAFHEPLPELGIPPERVIAELAEKAEPGLVATSGPRFLGFVIGGSLPVAIGADWLTSTWDQNAGGFAASPAAAVVEEVTASWLLDLFGLPPTASVGFVTGCQMATFTCLAAARHAVLDQVGWDVAERGLIGAPRVDVVVGEEAHLTVFTALRMLGFGIGTAKLVEADRQGRMRLDHLREILAGCDGPTIVCAQAGNVNTGAFDALEEIADETHARGAWLHIDGAFGLWAAVSPNLSHHLAGMQRADSWAVDAHKWLNVPYDSGVAIVAHPAPHRAAMISGAAYLVRSTGEARDPNDWTPELSRRARGFAVYATLRALGRRGIRELIEGSCAIARSMAARLTELPGTEVLNDVVLNQVLVAFTPPAWDDADTFTRRVIAHVQAEGTCWPSATVFQGTTAMRISVCNWATTEEDVAASVAAIRDALRCSNSVSAQRG
jgi:glutamate/tyrosine decarboxylase-like PLP-dependent enzyme